MIDKVFYFMGVIFVFFGIAGLASACEGEGSFLISAIVLGFGLAFSLVEFIRGTEWEDKF